MAISRNYLTRADAVRALADATAEPAAREELLSMERAWRILAQMAERNDDQDAPVFDPQAAGDDLAGERPDGDGRPGDSHAEG